MATTVLNGLGQALRWLRDRQHKKQYQVANAAGITKGMLSAYETGRQRPSLETLEKILDTLGCDLVDLHNALQLVNGRPEAMKRRVGDLEHENDRNATPEGDRGWDVRRTLGLQGPLAREEEVALSQMIEGFQRFLRYLHDRGGEPY